MTKLSAPIYVWWHQSVFLRDQIDLYVAVPHLFPSVFFTENSGTVTALVKLFLRMEFIL